MFACLVGLVVLAPVPSFARATSFANIRLEGLPAIYVQDQAGRETEGKLVSFTDSALVLSVNRTTQTFAPAQVRRVQRRGDSLKNGTIIGLAFGVVRQLAGDRTPGLNGHWLNPSAKAAADLTSDIRLSESVAITPPIRAHGTVWM